MGLVYVDGKKHLRKYHYLIRPKCDWNNERAREYVSTCLNPELEHWEVVALMGYSDKEVNDDE